MKIMPRRCDFDGRAAYYVWIPVEQELPPMDVPVWLYLPDIRQPVIGCRSDGGEGWLWCRCYDDYWFNGEWKTSTADADDDKPSHWMPLPLPPNVKREHLRKETPGHG